MLTQDFFRDEHPHPQSSGQVRPGLRAGKRGTIRAKSGAGAERDAVAFPRLSSLEIVEASRFGSVIRYETGETLTAAGDFSSTSFIVLAGTVRELDSDYAVFARYSSGHFTGDVDLIAGRCSVSTLESETEVTVLALTTRELKELFRRHPHIADRFWHAMHRRRGLMMNSTFRSLTVYGSREDRATLELVDFLSRNMVSHRWEGAHSQPTSQIEQRQPIVMRGDRVLFEGASRAEVGTKLGLRRSLEETLFDVVVLGAGPSGLCAAVNASSEGLATLVLDAVGPGGQAGSSSRIENYAGFVNGVSGAELASQSYLQALRFGTTFLCPANVCSISRDGRGLLAVRTREGDVVHTKTVIIATGVSYNLFPVQSQGFSGAGIFHSATELEATGCAGGEVHIVGGGNSAGQAAVYLSQVCSKVTLVLRGRDLRKSMSAYLCSRLQTLEKVCILYETEVTAVRGERYITNILLTTSNGDTVEESTRGLFVFIGAKPRTDFLSRQIAVDDKGFIITGAAVIKSDSQMRNVLPLETSLHGVFAAGDCRAGTPKRVTSAMGDGAFAVNCVHQYLASASTIN